MGVRRGLRLGLADHLGWAVAVTATVDHDIVDRRRIDLVDPGLPAAPIHHVGGPHELHRHGDALDDRALTALVAQVRASAARATAAAMDQLSAELPEAIVSMSLRAWPDNFPDDITVQRQVPYESRADPIMYRQVLAEEAQGRGWAVHLFDAKGVERAALGVLGQTTDRALHVPRTILGPPWSKDHRMAFAATIVAP